MEYSFTKASYAHAEAVLALYEEAKGSEFCVWNAFYPTQQEIGCDLEAGGLYILTSNGDVIGALSVVPENELDGFDCFKCADGTQKEIARVVVAEEYRGKGLSFLMVQKITDILFKSGCNAIHLSVAKTNLPAYKTYLKAGFSVVGEAEMYGNQYFLMEKRKQYEILI